MKILIILLLLAIPAAGFSQLQEHGKIRLETRAFTTHSFPAIFETGAIPDYYKGFDEATLKAVLCADGLSAWGSVMAGQKQPAKFGEGMYLIGATLGILATPQNLMKYADEILKE